MQQYQPSQDKAWHKEEPQNEKQLNLLRGNQKLGSGYTEFSVEHTLSRIRTSEHVQPGPESRYIFRGLELYTHVEFTIHRISLHVEYGSMPWNVGMVCCMACTVRCCPRVLPVTIPDTETSIPRCTIRYF